MCVHH
jgi:hypothetical protein